MLGFSFSYSEHRRFQINIPELPPDCLEITVSLPTGDCLSHTLGVASPSLTLEELIKEADQFQKHLKKVEKLKMNTLNGYRLKLGQFFAWLANTQSDPSDPAVWYTYYTSLSDRELNGHTCKNHYHILKRFCDWLVKQRRLYKHPFGDIKAPEIKSNPLPKAIFEDNFQAMLAATETARDQALLLFFRDTGCRAAEALSLKWSDLDLNIGWIWVEGKNDKTRPLFLQPITLEAIQIYRETTSHQKTDAVWLSDEGALTYSGLYKIFKRLAKKVGIDDQVFNPHSFRHAFGRDMTAAGMPTLQLQDLMGHSTPEVTKIYTRFEQTDLREAHNRYSPLSKMAIALRRQFSKLIKPGKRGKRSKTSGDGKPGKEQGNEVDGGKA
jgi:site-specific recombinase XerD